MGYNKKKHSNYSAPCARNQKKKAKKVNVPKTIKYGGKTYKVTKILAKVLQNNKTVSEITVGANVNAIEKNAFDGCENLKTLKIKSKVLKKVGKNALRNTNKKCKIKVPKAKKSDY